MSACSSQLLRRSVRLHTWAKTTEATTTPKEVARRAPPPPLLPPLPHPLRLPISPALPLPCPHCQQPPCGGPCSLLGRSTHPPLAKTHLSGPLSLPWAGLPPPSSTFRPCPPLSSGNSSLHATLIPLRHAFLFVLCSLARKATYMCVCLSFSSDTRLLHSRKSNRGWLSYQISSPLVRARSGR